VKDIACRTFHWKLEHCHAACARISWEKKELYRATLMAKEYFISMVAIDEEAIGACIRGSGKRESSPRSDESVPRATPPVGGAHFNPL
jgi:hypothetical protein